MHRSHKIQSLQHSMPFGGYHANTTGRWRFRQQSTVSVIYDAKLRHRQPCQALPMSARSRCQRACADVVDEVPCGPVAMNCNASAAATTSSSLSAAARHDSVGFGFDSAFSSPSRQRIASTIVSKLPLRCVPVLEENGPAVVLRPRRCETSKCMYSEDMRRSRSSCRWRSAICRRSASTTGLSADSSPHSTFGESIPPMPSSDDSVSSLRRLDMLEEVAEMLENLVKLLSSSSSTSQMSIPRARSRRVRRSLHVIKYERSFSRAQMYSTAFCKTEACTL